MIQPITISIGGLVVKLAVAKDLIVYNFGQPRVRFPVDARDAPEGVLFCLFKSHDDEV